VQPFAGEPRAVVVLPSADPTLGGRRALLELEPAAFEAELGAPVEVVETDPGEGARLLLVVDVAHAGPPTMSYRRAEKLLEARGADADGILEALNLLRTAARVGGEVAATDCRTLDEAIERVVLEVAETYPAFALRGLDWSEICRRHVAVVASASDEPLPAFQRWLAELEDGHTWAWPRLGNLPYAVRLGGGATFVRLREGSAGWEAGVRPGWRLIAIDGAEVGEGDWLARAAAPPHSRPLIAGRRLLSGPVGVSRELTAASPDGLTAVWEEAPTALPADPLVSWSRLERGCGYLRIEAWVGGAVVEEAVGAALYELRGCDSLVLDLRGNPGGDLVLACGTRDRFLREQTTLGSIRYSTGGGELSSPAELVGEPADAVERWAGRLVVLTDELTFSSSEDFLLGLQGLEHVTVVGRSSGGGSGRPRALRLLPGTTLTVSTALTYDREGHCVEGAGIPVDVEVAGGDDELLEVARSVAS
jgi:carboxyl-terminal processing protease